MINPVFKKELKTRMRSWKIPALISIYILIFSSLMLLIFSDALFGYNSYGSVNLSDLKEMFFIISILQLILIIFIVPATTAGSISGEKERSTLELLICTRLSSISIITGKLMSSLVEIILLLLVSIPILSILFLFGGISIGNILVLFLFYFITSIFFGSIGIFASTYFRRTSTSTIISYFVTLTLVGGTFLIILMLQIFYFMPRNISGERVFEIILYVNPFSGMATILSNMLGQNILGGIVGTTTQFKLLPLFINLGFDIIASAILLYLSALKINPMSKIGSKNFRKVKKSK